MNSSKQIKIGALLSYIAIGINILTGLLYTPWMIRSIGKEDYGLYALAMSVISLFFFDFGLGSAVTRFISKYLAENRQDKANQCLSLVYRLYLGIDVLLICILVGVYFFIPQIYKQLTPDEIDKFKIVYAMASLYCVLSFPFIPLNGVLTAYEQFIPLKLCEIASRVLIVLFMSILLLLGYGLYAMVFVNASVGICMIIAKLICLYKFTIQKVVFSYWNKNELKEIASYSGWVTIIALAQRCIFNIAPSILGALSGSASIAILGIAITIEGFIFTFANALSGMFLPKVSRIYASSGDILPLMVRIGRVQIIIISLVVFGFICFGYDFINLWVGNQFALCYICTVLIITPSLLQLPQEIGVQAIIAQNQVKMQALVYAGMALLNIVGAFILSPKYGAVGLCCSISIAYIARTVGLDYILSKRLKINIWSFFKLSYLKLLPTLALSLIIGYVYSKYIPWEGWYGLIIKCGLFTVSYLVIIYFGSMNQYEKNFIIFPILKIGKRNR